MKSIKRTATILCVGVMAALPFAAAADQAHITQDDFGNTYDRAGGDYSNIKP